MLWHEIKFQPERTRTFLGSPSILRLPDGALLATHDYFGPGCPRTVEGEEGLTSVYRSEDDGATWVNITHIMNCYWNALFWHQGAVYLIGTSQEYGHILIRRSEDGGFTWTHPKDESSGLLFRGGAYREPPNYHCAAMPILRHERRLYRAFEDCTPNNWGRGFQSGVISVAEDADLLNAANWRMSNMLAFDPAWVPAEWGALVNPGWLEGNCVIAPDGGMVNILRFHSAPLVDRAAVIRVHDEGQRITFDPASGFIDFPGGMTKFSIRHDPKTGKYLSFVNPNTDPRFAAQRNILAFAYSDDLWHWQIAKVVMRDDTGLTHEDSIRLTGFQYVDWQFDGDDLIYVVRTAYRGAIRYHDSNRIIYRVLKNYAALLP